VDRTYRCLGPLQDTASTARVLNLAAIEAANYGNIDYVNAPLLKSRVLNSSIILKHRLRADERYLFQREGTIATKIIIPFDRRDLALGAQSVFVGAPGWEQFLREVSQDEASLKYDMAILLMLDQMPSLDPFLLRELLLRNGVFVAEAYFALSRGDVDRMRAYVSCEIRRLIGLALDGSTPDQAISTARMVEALLSTEVDERLEPLRKSMMIDEDTFREGVFCWKGFLYYKWSVATLTDELAEVVDELGRLTGVGDRDPELLRYMEGARRRLRRGIAVQLSQVRDTLKVYDSAFDDLIEGRGHGAFRNFLTHSPDLFMQLGEGIAGLSHIASFWRYRFPRGRAHRITLPDAVDMLGGLEESLSLPTR
jgi:hypothetical protein